MESRADIANVANTFEYYGSLAPFIYGETIPMPGNLFDYTLREPLGVCALIVPWNFPMLIAAWKIGPCLATGNTAILKPASNTPLGAVLLGQLALEAGLPERGAEHRAGPRHGRRPTRSAPTPTWTRSASPARRSPGREILRLGADTVKKVTLELGGKSPNIVFPDADMSQAVQGSLPGDLWQCRAALHRAQPSLRPSARPRGVRRALRPPKPSVSASATHLTPTRRWGRSSRARRSSGWRATSRSARTRARGSPRAAAGRTASGLAKGNYLLPTVLDGVQNQMRVAQEEMFGPVLSVIDFASLDDVIREANDISYGLGASIWTRDLTAALTIARRLSAGNISINNPTVNYIYAPFGGYKQSGLGRELGRNGVDLFTQVKNVVIDLSQ